MSDETQPDDKQEETQQEENTSQNVLSFEEEKERIRREIEEGFINVRNSTKSSDEDEFLKQMNSRHAFIHSYGGRPMVLSYVYSNVDQRKIIEFRTPESIAIQYSNQSVQLGKNYVELGRWWIKHSARREYETVIFDPSLPKEHKNCFNMYQGLNVEPTQGSWKRTLRHLYKVLCNSDREKFTYTMKWFAWCLQNPGKRAEVVMIFKGKEGAGKGFIFSQFVHIFGNHGLHISNRKHLTGDFNGHLATCVFLFADEAYYPGDKEVEGALNQLISEERVAIEKKRLDVVVTRNCLHIGMATNSEWIIPASGEARRYFINEVENTYAKSQMSDRKREKYFNALWGEMNNGGREAMVNDLLKMDLTDWHPRFNVPVTSELKKQVSISIHGVDKTIAAFLELGEFPGDANRENTLFTISAKALEETLCKISPTFNRFAPKLKGGIYRKIGGVRKHQAKGSHWVFPTLKECKERYIKEMHLNYEFDVMDEVWSTGRELY